MVIIPGFHLVSGKTWRIIPWIVSGECFAYFSWILYRMGTTSNQAFLNHLRFMVWFSRYQWNTEVSEVNVPLNQPTESKQQKWWFGPSSLSWFMWTRYSSAIVGLCELDIVVRYIFDKWLVRTCKNPLQKVDMVYLPMVSSSHLRYLDMIVGWCYKPVWL